MLSPFNYLHNIPFHALDSVRNLIDHGRLHEVVYLPGTGILTSLSNRRPKRRITLKPLFVGYAEDDEIKVQEELKIFCKSFPEAVVLNGQSANRQHVIAALSDAEVIHFACHGRADEAERSSYLELADGRLYPADIAVAEGFNPELVFLNACVTGVAMLRHGRDDQTVGLHTVALLRGARQVIATMWEANDLAALEFTKRFYEGWLQREDRSTAEVVVETYKSLMRQSADPFYWASHALFGDWR
jgi:CHAT domain-containing protein